MQTRLAIATLGLGLGLSVAGCSSCNSKPSGTDAGASTSSLSAEQAARVLVKVGDRTITLGDYVAVLEHMDQFDRIRYQSSERRKELLTEMINVTLLAEEARAKGYDKEPLAQQETRAILRDAMLAQARKGVPGPGDIAEAEVKGYFDAHKPDFSDPERRRVSVIVLKDEASAKETLDLARKASAAEWANLVRKRSKDPLAGSNVPTDLAGDFGMVSPPGDPRGDNPKVPAEVRAAAFTIANKDEVLDRAVKSGEQFYVVRLTQKSPPHERTLAEADRTIRVKLAQDKIRAKEEELLNGLRAQFPVQIDEQALANVKVEPAPPASSPTLTPSEGPRDGGHADHD